ncbi:hypothetical protein ONZ51_g3023 [Trametes cubensis]|uniref:Uncharacterized protein n=1 Tax=Trametes cubensis TaxID=1111947 RepID=A0AAD7U0X3_9APHY|nr:hypothetical protein ONZ51_g3023 [Trametes cubensis]
MPAPAVYIAVAVFGVVALVYEPHIAPKVEVWAESFLERRKQKKRQRQGPVLADPHPIEQGDENSFRRSGSSLRDKKHDDDSSMSIELEHLAVKERDAWRQDGPGPSSGLRQRKPASAMDESNSFIPYPAMSPTHVLFDTSEPPSPSGRSSTLSSPHSSNHNSPSPQIITLSDPQSRTQKSPSPPPRVVSPRLPTPMSNFSPVSTRAVTPSTAFSAISSRRPTPDISASQALTSAYNTPLGGSVVSERSQTPSDIHSFPGSRIQSPFSDIHSVDARSSPEQVYTRSPVASPRVQSPSIGSDLTMDSDDEFDILSPRSGMFSPPSQVHNTLFFPDDASQHGSDVSWASVGRRTPEF